MNLLLVLASSVAAFAADYTVRIDASPAVTQAQVVATYRATQNLWYPGCRSYGLYMVQRGPATRDVTLQLAADGEGLAASFTDSLGGFCGYEFERAALTFRTGELISNGYVWVLPNAVPGVTRPSSQPFACRERGDEIAGYWLDCRSESYAFENNEFSLRVDLAE